jgi:steroid delta-isomerase-like uncharacterized protein
MPDQSIIDTRRVAVAREDGSPDRIRRKYGGQMTDVSLRERREAVVREHMESENRHAFGETLKTFEHPRYELIATGEVHDGEEQVSRYYEQTRTAFPDQRNEVIALHHADDGVIVEFDLLGTHLGSFRGVPPTGRAFRCRMAAFFLFSGDRIVIERVYFDANTILRQLGLAHDPLTLVGRLVTAVTHPVTLTSAFVRHLLHREPAVRPPA